jgi:hypothetical protein
LRELEGAIESSGASATHPRELVEQADFKRTVGLLEDADTDTVVRFALGHDWGLACAGVAAKFCPRDYTASSGAWATRRQAVPNFRFRTRRVAHPTGQRISAPARAR